jgi:hypothetical protein
MAHDLIRPTEVKVLFLLVGQDNTLHHARKVSRNAELALGGISSRRQAQDGRVEQIGRMHEPE